MVVGTELLQPALSATGRKAVVKQGIGTELDRLYQGDCVESLGRFDAESVDLVFADPPFNIGYDYDIYNDHRDAEHYLSWSHRWGEAIRRVLKSTGTFWLAIGDEYAAELKLLFQRELGFTCRSWVIWYYTFGVNCTKKFSRSHAHLFHFVRDAKRFTFNSSAIRVPSARQLVYADSRADADGRLPDDTWILRPQDLPHGFQPDEDTWYFSRVCGTFKERKGWHGCQMPEQLLGRIIRACSNPGEVVLDPFAGSGTTLVVAKKLGRRWLGFELSKNYFERIQARLEAAWVGQPLEGAEEPKVSAPPTPAEPRGTRRQSLRTSRRRARQTDARSLF
jgi:site-specific DNA-methyltransferase (adenine-specific)